MKKAGRLVVEFLEPCDLATFTVGFGIMCFFDDGNAGAIGQFLHRINKREVFILHQKRDGIPTLTTAEALVVLPGRIDIERRRLLVVERAIALEGRACPLEREVGSDQIDNVRRLKDLFDCFWRNPAHWQECESDVSTSPALG